MADGVPTKPVIVASGVTIDEYFAGEWPPGSELVDGQVIVTDATLWHQELCARILFALRVWVRAGIGRGLAGFGGNWTLAPAQSYKPDVWWVSRSRTPDLDALFIHRPPDVVVEVRSPSTWLYDIGRKLKVYEASGARELWLVDHPANTVLVLRRSTAEASEFDQAAELDLGDTLTSPLLDGFALPLAELFTR